MIEAKSGSRSRIFHWLSGECLFVTIQETETIELMNNLYNEEMSVYIEDLKWGSLELAENVSIFSRDACSLQHSHTECEFLSYL